MSIVISGTSGVDSSVEELLREVGKFVHPAKERTLFSLGGRSYYENPASDLLAFFLTPDAEHGFGCLFLSVFMDCMKGDQGSMSFHSVTVGREVETQEGNRIDVLVEGSDWVLVIENKVYHAQVNPFASYETHARKLRGGDQPCFAILSPDGQSARTGWTGVSYKGYCRALRERLAEVTYSVPYSKWHVFAREFILHLENELYTPVMTLDQAAFVEKHADGIEAVKKLDEQYRTFLEEELKRRLSAAIPGNVFTTKVESWAIRCSSPQWDRSNIAFRSEGTGTSRKFQLTVYLIGLSQVQRSKADAEFRQLRPWTEKAWLAWQTQPGFENREDALKELCRLGGIVAALFKAPDDPLPPPPTSVAEDVVKHE